MLKGTPWYAGGIETVESRLLVLRLIIAAERCGLELLLTSDISRHVEDASSFFFIQSAQSPSTPADYFCLATSGMDTLRLIGVSAEHAHLVEHAVTDAIAAGWPRGVQDMKTKHGVPNWKLRGNPWWAEGEETVQMRQLVCHLLANLGRLGFVCISSADVDKKSDSLFFRYDPGAADPLGSEYVALQMAQSDRVRFVEFSPIDAQRMRDAVAQGWPRGIQAEKVYAGQVELKLSGNPWWADGADAVHSRELVTHMLGAMAHGGWKLAAVADLMQKASDKSSWFFVRRPGTVEAPPLINLLAISLNESDKVRVVGGQPATRDAVIVAVLAAIEAGWPFGVQKVSDSNSGTNAWEVKLNGSPWWANLHTYMHTYIIHPYMHTCIQGGKQRADDVCALVPLPSDP